MRRTNPAPNARASRAIFYKNGAGAESSGPPPAKLARISRWQGVSLARETLSRRHVDLDLSAATGGSRRGLDVSSFVQRRASQFRQNTGHTNSLYSRYDDGTEREAESRAYEEPEEKRFTLAAGQLDDSEDMAVSLFCAERKVCVCL